MTGVLVMLAAEMEAGGLFLTMRINRIVSWSVSHHADTLSMKQLLNESTAMLLLLLVRVDDEGNDENVLQQGLTSPCVHQLCVL